MVKKRSPNGVSQDLLLLTDDERRALRGSKFAPLPSNVPSPSSSLQQQQQLPRMAHPGGPMTTNKAAALAKFLERKLQHPGGLDSIKPELLELAVKNAKEAVNAGGSSGTIVRHVSSFDDSAEESEEAAPSDEDPVLDKKKKRKQKTGNTIDKLKAKKKKRRKLGGSKCSDPKKPKKQR